MTPLKNQRHEAFARHLAEGASQTEAYVKAGYKDTRAAGANAARLIKNDSVRERVQTLKSEAADQAIVTVSDVLRGLRREAENAETASARVSAWAHLGKHLDMFTDRQEVTIKRDPREMTTDELEEYLRVRGLLD